VPIRVYKPCTPGTRFRSNLFWKGLFKGKFETSLVFGKKRMGGRNNRGLITLRGRGGGHKRKYRRLDFQRRGHLGDGRVLSIEYDPNRSAYIARLAYLGGDKVYILCPRNLVVGQKICSGEKVPIKIGNSMPLEQIPLGTFIHNVELNPSKGGQISRAAGTFSQLIAKGDNFVTLKLPSGEVRLFNKRCFGTIGQVGNVEFNSITFGKAGRKRWLGKRPKVRGVVKNPVDHPHGGGEGRSSIGRVAPSTPWGKVALGPKTRNLHKKSNRYILRARK